MRIFRNLMCVATFLFASAVRASLSGQAIGSGNPSQVFANGTNGYKCFRIPAVVQTPDGTIIAFAEGRRNGCGDFGDVQVVMRASHDGGATWGPLAVVASNGNLQADNAVPIVDTLDPRYPKGRIFLIYATGDAPESAIRNGKGARRIWYRTTVDDGTTWTAPVEITSSVKPVSWRNYSVGPGHGLQLMHGARKGRIVVAAYHSEGPPQPGYRDSEANAIFSDDHGHTWSLGATVAWPGSNESTTAEAARGAVVMNSRDQSGASHARILSFSKDGTERWNKSFVARDLPDPVCEGSMISYFSKKGKPVLLFSNAGSTTNRKNLTVSASTDSGKTWPKHTVIDAGPSAYSDLVILRGGLLGILWERGNEGGIVFLARPIETLF